MLHGLRRQVIGEDADVPVATFDCQERLPDWRDVADELATVSLFGGGGPRLVILERADSFVSADRTKLEDHVANDLLAGLRDLGPAMDTFGRLDGMHVNFTNAADAYLPGGVVELPLEAFDEVMRVNTRDGGVTFRPSPQE